MTPAALVLKSNQMIASGLIKLESYAQAKWLSLLIWIAVCVLLFTGKAVALIEKFFFLTAEAVTPAEQRKWIKLSAIFLLFFVAIQVGTVGEAYRADAASAAALTKPKEPQPLQPLSSYLNGERR